MIIKRVLLGILLVIAALAVLITGYLFSIKVDRPAGDIDPISVLHKEKFKDKAIQAEKWLETVYQRHEVPSFSVSVGVQGTLAWESVIGYSDLDNKIRADQSTQYRIGSVSKPITAAAIMRMQDKGILDIDRDYDTYVKGYPPQNSGFTLKQLMTHQGGVRHYLNPLTEGYSNKEYSSRREAASIVENAPLLFAPGEGFHYSTYGYTLLALAMESVYSKPFEEIMDKEIFTPIGMASTTFDKVDESSPDNVAIPYLHVGESLYQSPNVNPSYSYAGGGYRSTPSDLVRFGNALLTDSFLKPASREAIWSPVALRNGEMNPQNYALGFRVGEDDLGRFVHHGGIGVGGYSFLLIYPEKEVVVALAANVTPSGNSFDRLKEAKKIARLFARQVP